MRLIVVHDGKLEREATKARIRRYLAFYILFFLTLFAVEVLLLILSDNVVTKLISSAGIIVFVFILAWSLLLDVLVQKRKEPVTDCTDIIWLGTKHISYTAFAPNQDAAIPDNVPDEDMDRLPYEKVRAIRENTDYIFIFYSFWQNPITINKNRENIEAFRQMLHGKIKHKIRQLKTKEKAG